MGLFRRSSSRRRRGGTSCGLHTVGGRRTRRRGARRTGRRRTGRRGTRRGGKCCSRAKRAGRRRR